MKYTRFIIQTPSGNLWSHTTMPFDEFMQAIGGEAFIIPTENGRRMIVSKTILTAWEVESEHKPTDSI